MPGHAIWKHDLSVILVSHICIKFPLPLDDLLQHISSEFESSDWVRGDKLTPDPLFAQFCWSSNCEKLRLIHFAKIALGNQPEEKNSIAHSAFNCWPLTSWAERHRVWTLTYHYQKASCPPTSVLREDADHCLMLYFARWHSSRKLLFLGHCLNFNRQFLFIRQCRSFSCHILVQTWSWDSFDMIKN